MAPGEGFVADPSTSLLKEIQYITTQRCLSLWMTRLDLSLHLPLSLSLSLSLSRSHTHALNQANTHAHRQTWPQPLD